MPTDLQSDELHRIAAVDVNEVLVHVVLALPQET
jgi:hypothetical protein